ncbi:DeoR/GlpR family DNA-binding transcription regulator [Streptomyces canus]|uniref:DeoR/GlpR family DNA-binding transcription regulator n=1 Tax=Streptomyces canus TaxID=58343 RepID=UPI002E2B2CA6|nr:DeoR/GlpR family DNA-binding transcription regulator [Streptomyces canus]
MFELVQAQGSVRIEDLSDHFGVSTMTIHRDLDHLHEKGVLRKVRSGAEARPSEAFEHDVRHREQLNTAEKDAIAASALAWVDQRVAMQAFALDDSTTAFHLLPLLRPRLPLTVVTNFLPAINALAAEPSARLTALGGDYNREFASFGGSAVVQSLSELHYDVVFMSVSAVARATCFHASRATADLKLAFMRSAELSVLMVDSTKFSRRAVHRIAPLADFDVVVTDDRLDPEEVSALRSSGVEVVLAPVDRPESIADGGTHGGAAGSPS